MAHAWRPLDERPGYAGFLRVTTRRYAMPDGHVSTWDILECGDTVAVVALTVDRDVVLVRQFRPGPSRILMELPGGRIEPDERPVEAAARELREERGFTADELTVVGRTWLAGYASGQRFAVLAQGCRQTADPTPDPEEFGETVLLPWDRFVAHVRTGDLTDVDVAYLCLVSVADPLH